MGVWLTCRGCGAIVAETYDRPRRKSRPHLLPLLLLRPIADVWMSERK